MNNHKKSHFFMPCKTNSLQSGVEMHSMKLRSWSSLLLSLKLKFLKPNLIPSIHIPSPYTKTSGSWRYCQSTLYSSLAPKSSLSFLKRNKTYLCSSAGHRNFPSFLNMIIFWCHGDFQRGNIHIQMETADEGLLKRN